MPTAVELTKQAETKVALERMQDFDVQTLPREKTLGDELNFLNAISPAERLIELYRRVSPSILPDLPVPSLDKLKAAAERDYSRLDQILNFSLDQGNPRSARDSYIQHLMDAYQNAFVDLQEFIVYSASRTTDFKLLDTEARLAISSIRNQSKELLEQLREMKSQADDVLIEVRKVAAEQGVSQQAIYFGNEAKSHWDSSNWWLSCTFIAAVLLLLWAFASLFLHKWEFLKPTTLYDSVQLGLSKALVFAVLSYAVYLSARNFLSHKHNSIVNKHRQNALVTYTAIVQAAGDKANRDVVLNHAAACIFAPQSTGYSNSSPMDGPTAKSVVEFLGKPFSES